MKHSAARDRIAERLGAALAELPARKLEQVADLAEHLRAQGEWEATLDLMSDEAMRKDIHLGRRQAARGMGRPWREIQRRVRG
ncbi:MAG: hypothetical protein HY699_22995 [Deltaproteobacteria bacterium]|nr:hypothetical protein [Deltaproteobacteria bacterium]